MDKNQIIITVEAIASLVILLCIVFLIKLAPVPCVFLIGAGVTGGVAEYLRRKE